MPLKIFRLVILIILFVLTAPTCFADQPPDPGGGNPTGDPVGGGSPIGSGLLITLVMSGIYSARKAIQYKRK